MSKMLSISNKINTDLYHPDYFVTPSFLVVGTALPPQWRSVHHLTCKTLEVFCWLRNLLNIRKYHVFVNQLYPMITVWEHKKCSEIFFLSFVNIAVSIVNKKRINLGPRANYSRFFENFDDHAQNFLFLWFWVTGPINVPFRTLDSR